MGKSNMGSFLAFLHPFRFGSIFCLTALVALVICTADPVPGEAAKAKVLRIGSTGTLDSGHTPEEDKAALATLKKFIKEETGFANEIVDEKDWRALAEQMANGRVQLGAFQGYEFAWAKERYPGLKPLALTVNVHTYPIAYVVVRKDSKAKDFAGLRGQSIALLDHGHGAMPRLFVDRQCEADGKKPKEFFSKVVVKGNVEDILDDLVDGVVNAAVVERVGMEAFKRRKPGRFNRLKVLAQSPPVLPPLIASYDNRLDQETLVRFRSGLLAANRKDKGQVLLTMFRLTGFEAPPANFDRLLGQTQKTFPPPPAPK